MIKPRMVWFQSVFLNMYGRTGMTPFLHYTCTICLERGLRKLKQQQRQQQSAISYFCRGKNRRIFFFLNICLKIFPWNQNKPTYKVFLEFLLNLQNRCVPLGLRIHSIKQRTLIRWRENSFQCYSSIS